MANIDGNTIVDSGRPAGIVVSSGAIVAIPVITNVTPPDAGNLAATVAASRSVSVKFDVTATGGLAMSIISIEMVGANPILVHDGVNFVGIFNHKGNTRVTIANGFRYTIIPLGGWGSSIEKLSVFAVNAGGGAITITS